MHYYKKYAVCFLPLIGNSTLSELYPKYLKAIQRLRLGRFNGQKKRTESSRIFEGLGIDAHTAHLSQMGGGRHA